MKRRDVMNWLGAAALGMLLLATATMASAAGAPADEPQGVAYALIDCADPGAAANAASIGVDADLLGTRNLGDSPQVGGGTCRLAGTGPFSYCTGECRYSHQQCEQVVTNTGFSCACRVPIRQ